MKLYDKIRTEETGYVFARPNPVIQYEMETDESDIGPCGFGREKEYCTSVTIRTVYRCNNAQAEKAHELAMNRLVEELYSDIRPELMLALQLSDNDEVRTVLLNALSMTMLQY